MKFIVGKRLPKIEPVIKLVPIIKLKGNSTVSFNKRLTLLLVELFWMPIKRTTKRDELKNFMDKNLYEEVIDEAKVDFSSLAEEVMGDENE